MNRQRFLDINRFFLQEKVSQESAKAMSQGTKLQKADSQAFGKSYKDINVEPSRLNTDDSSG